MEDSLVSRRSKRSTAGNRMEAALAEFKAEDLGMDVEEDADFALDKDEEDVFESDFESTDEEGAQEDVDAAAETLIRQEESRVRKSARTHLERITALAHARQAVTFNPDAAEQPAEQKQKKLKRRVSLGVAVNAETGEVLDAGSDGVEVDAGTAARASGRRHSTRTHTVANTSAADIRARDEVRKQSSAPKRVKTKIKAPTQTELIARALDMEEGNIEQHKNYLTLEEEKRKKARVVRASVQGPLIRWISKKEEVTVIVQPPPPTPPPAPAPAPPPSRPPVNPYVHYRYSVPPSGGAQATKYRPYTYTSPQYSTTPYSSGQHASNYSQYSATTSQYMPNAHTSPPPPPPPFAQWPPPPEQPAYHYSNTSVQSPTSPSPSTTIATTSSAYHSPTSSAVASPPTAAPASTVVPTYTPVPPQPPPSPPQPIERKETVAKQFVVHELGQTEKTTRPNWASTMTAMFGDHADWEKMRVYITKGRPFARPTQTCPITGKVAKYVDPRTGVPYADLDAYKVLSAILRHEYVWSPSLGCYVSQEGSVFAESSA